MVRLGGVGRTGWCRYLATSLLGVSAKLASKPNYH